MPRIEQFTQINAPVEAVWDLMSDAKRYPEWVEATDRMISAPDEPMNVGYEYEEYGGIPPFKSDSVWRVTEFEPHRRQVHTGDDGSMTMNLVIELTETESGTNLMQSIDLKSRLWMRPLAMLMWPLLMRRRGDKIMEDTGANVKKLLESSD
jgi:uncharacterized protein YndB with AHSA1/START domain